MDVFKKKKTGFSKNHPTYIYKKINDDYIFVGVTHSDVTNNTKNKQLENELEELAKTKIDFDYEINYKGEKNDNRYFKDE